MKDIDSVQQAIDYIEEHLDQEIELAAIAQEAFLSQAQLYRVFYALTGHAVKAYIRKRRISMAAVQLRYSNKPIEHIAWDSGFESYHSFAKVFKKLVGLSPAAYRAADLFYSFESIRLREQVLYMETHEQAEVFPDVKVMRLWPTQAHAHLYVSTCEAGIERAAFQTVYDETCRLSWQSFKLRYFGYNVDIPGSNGIPSFGYRVLVVGAEHDSAYNGNFFQVETFLGGLYAVRKITELQPERVQEAWDRLLAEWLPKSTFDRARQPCVEQFTVFHGRIVRMNLYLPVERSFRPQQIEIVDWPGATALFSRGYGKSAQEVAEHQLTQWYMNTRDEDSPGLPDRYYMSYAYGTEDQDEYWWENGVLCSIVNVKAPGGLVGNINNKLLSPGLYACCVTKTYGKLTGVLDKMHRWIAVNTAYQLDGARQWFAEYVTFDGTDIELDSLVKLYLPIQEGMCDGL